MAQFEETYTEVEQHRIDSEFKRLSSQRLHYLDHAGSALYSEQQINDVHARLNGNLYCNPHTSALTEIQVDQVREMVLDFFNTDSSEYDVVFTRGATESLKIVAETFDFQTSGSFMYLRNAHNSVLGMRAIVNTKHVQVVEVDRFLSLEYTEDEPPSVYSLSNSLMVFPAQCNFNGYKYPLNTIDKFHKADLPTEFLGKSKNWYVCLDAANYVSTSFLDLGKFRPDFVVLSFYKIFGYPTGLGALLVSRRGQAVLSKKYHGGGTLDFALSNVEVHRKRSIFHERFEDGTPAFLSIISLLSGFDTLRRLVPPIDGLRSMQRISLHVFHLAKFMYEEMKSLRHSNGRSLITFYNQTEFQMDDQPLQGGIITFNVHRFNGEIAGYNELEGLAEMNNIFLRTGCFCNPGACQSHLGLENHDVMAMTLKGQSCNEFDAIGDQPFGFVRVSMGYVTNRSDVEKFLRVLREYFLGQVMIPRSPSNKVELLQIRIFPLRNGAPLVISSQWSIRWLQGDQQKLRFDGHWSVVNARQSIRRVRCTR